MLKAIRFRVQNFQNIYDSKLSISHQAELLGISRSSVYYEPVVNEYDLLHLLRNVAIDRKDQVWAADITYIPLEKVPSTIPTPNGVSG